MMQSQSLRLTVPFVLLTFAAAASDACAQGAGGGGTPQQFQGGALFGSEKRHVDVQGASLSATNEVVTEIRIEGNKTVPSSRILAQLKTRVGRAYDPEALGDDVKKLASMPWFVNVQPLSRPVDSGRLIILRVSERSLIRYIDYLGNANFTDKKLGKETGLKIGQAIDPYAVEDGRRKLEEMYRKSGYARAQITILEGDKTDDQGVIFVINEGVQQKISSVTFEGNNSDFASDRRLKTKIKSKPGILWLVGGKLNREQLDSDVQALTAYYRAFGFFQARVGRVIEFNDAGTWATIRFVIHEGPRYNVRNVRFMGAERFPVEALSQGVKLPAGEPFEQAKLNADVEYLKQVYGSRGYVFADVRAEPVFLEEPGQIDVVYHIEEGKKWRVGRIFVHIDGENPHTKIQTALDRLSIRPGEVVDIRELQASERRLQASRLFMHEPARGVTPKITYRIPEYDDTEFTASGGSPQFRGQSPAGHRSYKPAVQDRPIDVHLLEGDNPATASRVYELHVRQPQPSRRHTVRKPPTGWRSPSYATQHRPAHTATGAASVAPNATTNATTAQRPIIRGQQPAAPTMPTYGGVTPKAISPAAAPAGYNAPAGAATGDVDQVQFRNYDSRAAEPAPAVVGAPYVAPNAPASVLPIEERPQLFPGGEFGAPGYGYPNDVVDLHVNAAETQTGRFMVGVGVNSDAGVVGQILIDEQNFDWRRFPTSAQDFYDGTAFRGGGQRFRIEAAPGTQVQRYAIQWQDPFFRHTPISLSLGGSYFTRRFLDWDEQRLGGRIGLGYQWTASDVSGQLTYRGESVEITDAANVPELAEVVGQDNHLHGFGVRLTNDTRNSPFLATQGHVLDLQLEQVIGTFDYPRAILEAKKYTLLRERPDHSGRHVFVMSSRVGFTGSNTPVYENFFAGGFSTLRGFDFRGASPVTNDGSRNVQVGGEFMFINSVEYMFPLTADDMINGVVFCDFGTVEKSIEIDEFRVAPGFGLRVTVPAMGPAPIALDFAFPVAKADFDDTQVFTFNVGFLR